MQSTEDDGTKVLTDERARVADPTLYKPLHSLFFVLIVHTSVLIFCLCQLNMMGEAIGFDAEPPPPRCFKMRRRCCGRFYCTLWCFRKKTDRLSCALLAFGVVR